MGLQSRSWRLEKFFSQRRREIALFSFFRRFRKSPVRDERTGLFCLGTQFIKRWILELRPCFSPTKKAESFLVVRFVEECVDVLTDIK